MFHIVTGLYTVNLMAVISQIAILSKFSGGFIFQTGQYDIDMCKLWVNILGECGTRVRSGVTVTTATTTVQEITPVEHSDIVCLLEDEFLKKCLREETC